MRESNSFISEYECTFIDFVDKYVTNDIKRKYAVTYKDKSVSLDYSSFHNVESFCKNKEFQEDYFIDWYGEGRHEGIVCKDGKFLSYFRGTGYQLSGNVNGQVDCGSGNGMNFLNSLDCEYSGDLKIFTEYFIDSCISSCYSLPELTENDRKFLNDFKQKQVSYIKTPDIDLDEIQIADIPNKIIFENTEYKVCLLEGFLVVGNKLEDITLGIEPDIMKNIRFEDFFDYEYKGNQKTNINTYIQLIKTLIYMSDNFKHSIKDLWFFDVKDFIEPLLEEIWKFNDW